MKKTKIFGVVVALALVLCVAFGASLAYLTAKPGNSLENTFIARTGLLEQGQTFTLIETATIMSEDGNEYVAAMQGAEGLEIWDEGSGKAKATTTTGNTYTDLIAGMKLLKDPVLHVGTTTSTTYLFVKVKVTGIPENVLDYDLSENLVEVDGAEGLEEGETLYVYTVDGNSVIAKGGSVDLGLIQGNKVLVNDSTKLAELTNGKIIFSAYLCQTAGFDTPVEAYNGCFVA